MQSTTPDSQSRGKWPRWLWRLVGRFDRTPEKRASRRTFNDVGCPVLPAKPTAAEIVQYLRDRAGWEKLQPYGREMDAREWAANALECAAERIKAAARRDDREELFGDQRMQAGTRWLWRARK
jgi:hypothetical protein